MTGYFAVKIPVKSYVKAYMIRELGPEMKLSAGRHVIYQKIYDLLDRHQNPERTDCNCNYNEMITLYIPLATYRKRGINLNATNIKNLNAFVEHLVKHRFHRLMDDLSVVLPSFEAHLPHVRSMLGIDIEAWSDDSMKKDYYRSRIKRNMPLFPKTFAGFVPSEKAAAKAF